MPLDHATALTAVKDWHQAAEAPLSEEDAEQIADSLVGLAAAVVPLIVDPDDELSPAQVQDYLLSRAVGQIADWLTRAASGLRPQLHIGPPTLRPDGSPALGVHTATLAELDTVPGIGPALAAAIARMARLHPDFASLTDLASIEGIGAKTLANLQQHVYMDSPAVTLTSQTHLDFALNPGPVTYLQVLHRSDLELTVADGTTLGRRPPQGGTPAQRMARAIDFLTHEAALAQSPASGVLAADAARHLSRRELLATALADTHPVDGQVLTDEAYLNAAAMLIAQAGERVLLMVFLGTATAGEPARPGPAALVEALEARAAAGVDVRVILDQDEDGVPYRSALINRPLHKRLTEHPQAQVKFDDPAELLHSKVLVIDHTAVIIGSHNWTRAGLQDAHELSVLLHGQPITDAYAARFQALWDTIP